MIPSEFECEHAQMIGFTCFKKKKMGTKFEKDLLFQPLSLRIFRRKVKLPLKKNIRSNEIYGEWGEELTQVEEE